MCDYRGKEICFQFFGWIFQLSTWTLIILCFIFRESNIFIILAVLSYVIYIITEFCSPISKYLRSRKKPQGIYQKMNTYFRTSPIISWSCECYHYETHHYTTRNDKGEIEHHTSTEKVVTYNGKSSMTYSSSRDVSGPFVLNCDEKNINKKIYVKLELNEEINFADSLTTSEYLTQKDSFVSAYKYRDAHFEFSERRYIPGLDEFALVNIGNEKARCMNSGLFFIFTMLSFAEFYKLYFDSKCIYQKFTIKKIISTSNNLYEGEYRIKYQKSVPSINLIKKQSNVTPPEYNYPNNSYKADLPSREEVENDKKDKIEIESIKKIETNQQNYNEVTIHNKNEHNISRSEENIPPAILPNEEEKSSERLKRDNKLFFNLETNKNNEINENDSIIFVNKQINFNDIDNKQ